MRYEAPRLATYGSMDELTESFDSGYGGPLPPE